MVKIHNVIHDFITRNSIFYGACEHDMFAVDVSDHNAHDSFSLLVRRSAPTIANESSVGGFFLTAFSIPSQRRSAFFQVNTAPRSS